MLPDLPTLKDQLQDVFNAYIQMRVDAQVGTIAGYMHIAHEGDRARLRPADGSMQDIDRNRASATVTIENSEIPTLTLSERFRRLDEMAQSMADQMSGQMIKTLMDDLEGAGRTLDATGRPFDAGVILDALEAMEMDFDTADGRPDLAIHISPAMVDKMKEAIEQSERDPSLRSRFEAIMARKKAGWRDREAARKLVG